MRNIDRVIEEVIAKYSRNVFDFEEGLDVYMVKDLIKRSTRREGSVDFYHLLNMVNDYRGELRVREADLEDAIEVLHDYGFGVVLDGDRVVYDPEMDYAA